jgi:Flp pilus assembly protein TadD
VLLNPNDAEARLGLCAYYLNKGDRQAAAREYKKLEALDKDLAKQLADLINK